MDAQMTALFLILRGARFIVSGLLSARIICLDTLNHFDESVRMLEDDCKNGGFDLSAFHKEIDILPNPEADRAKDEYKKID